MIELVSRSTYKGRFACTSIALLALLSWSACGNATELNATQFVVNPSADGSIYTSPGSTPVSNGAYVLVSGSIQGVIEFPLQAIDGTVTSAILSINPYGLPLHGETMQLYGYQSYDGILTAADGFAGTFLGSWPMPQSPGFGQDINYDVTAFLSTVDSPYVGFNLRSSTGTNVFSSLEYNYGHPSQLHITTVPEPGLLLTAFLLLFGLVMCRRGHGSIKASNT